MKKRRVDKTPKKKLEDKNHAKYDMHIIRKSPFQLHAPATNLTTQKELSKMSFRQKMMYITRKSKQDSIKEKGIIHIAKPKNRVGG